MGGHIYGPEASKQGWAGALGGLKLQSRGEARVAFTGTQCPGGGRLAEICREVLLSLCRVLVSFVYANKKNKRHY